MTTDVKVRPGEVMPLSRRLSICPDPLPLYAALTDNGRRPDTFLLESADITTQRGERSLLGIRSALRMTCRGREVAVNPLSPNGLSVLPWIARGLRDKAEVDLQPESLTVRFPEVPHGGSEAERMHAASPLDALRQMAMSWKVVSNPAPLSVLCAGVFSYDLLEVFETLPRATDDPYHYPELVFWLPEVLAVIDHRDRTTTLLALVFGGAQSQVAYGDAMAALENVAEQCSRDLPPVPGRGATGEVQSDMSDAEYGTVVEDCKRHIVAGDVFQIVPSRTFRAPCADPLAAYSRLRALNPSPYMFYIQRREDTLFGASPETSVKVSGTPRRVEIRPIAGTRARGRRADGSVDEDLDSRLEAELRMDEKELCEHMMLVDLARNDVARVSRPGTRRVDRLLGVDKYSHVMHLVSHVSGELRAELDALHAYAASMNMGTLVGAPKLEAASILRRLEATKRGPYGGTVGYLTADGQMDTAI
ncbi:MAG: anthranilate synthase component 1, partial [Candidatus Xenobia bacterium]